MTHTINVPKPFPTDTPEQQAKAMLNYFTHRFTSGDGDIRCADCDCRSTHKASHYPCGEEPPRILRTFDDDNKIVSEVEA